MLFAYGFIVGIIAMRLINACSPSFKEDQQGQAIVYDKGYEDGYNDCTNKQPASRQVW